MKKQLLSHLMFDFLLALTIISRNNVTYKNNLIKNEQ